MLKECRARVDAIRKQHLENKLGKANKTAAKPAADDNAQSGQKKKGA